MQPSSTFILMTFFLTLFDLLVSFIELVAGKTYIDTDTMGIIVAFFMCFYGLFYSLVWLIKRVIGKTYRVSSKGSDDGTDKKSEFESQTTCNDVRHVTKFCPRCGKETGDSSYCSCPVPYKSYCYYCSERY